MVYLYIVLCLIAVMLVYMRLEASMLKVERVHFSGEPHPLKLVLLSDIHIKFLKVGFKAIRRALEKENPDMILLAGDYIDGPHHIPQFMQFFQQTLQGYKICLCLGNHDYKAFRQHPEGLRDFVQTLAAIEGVTVLNNRSIPFFHEGRRFRIIGLGDYGSGKADAAAALRECRHESEVCVGITHNPELVLYLPSGSLDYLFCGHFHGGQIWAPFGLEFKLMRREKLCKAGIRRGLHQVNGIRLYLSRGLGNVCFPLRLRSRPEITVIEL